MQRRPIGSSGLEIAPLMLGCNMFGWTVDRAGAFAILDRFLDAGFNAIDTADVYSVWVEGNQGGESEKILGEWLSARGGRDGIVLATKVGSKMPSVGSGLSAAHIVHSIEGSLRRLRTDYVDLYQSHTDDAEVPLDETFEAYSRLIAAGKVRAIGASHYSAERLAEAADVSAATGLPRYDSVQPRYNLFDRWELEGPLQQVCLAREIGVLGYSTLAKGFLTGTHRAEAAHPEGAWGEMIRQRYANDRGYRILAALDAVGAEQGVTPAEIAVAWMLAQPGIAAAIVGVERVDQLEMLLGSARIALSEDQLERLAMASAAEGHLRVGS